MSQLQISSNFHSSSNADISSHLYLYFQWTYTFLHLSFCLFCTRNCWLWMWPFFLFTLWIRKLYTYLSVRNMMQEHDCSTFGNSPSKKRENLYQLILSLAMYSQCLVSYERLVKTIIKCRGLPTLPIFLFVVRFFSGTHNSYFNTKMAYAECLNLT